MSMYEVGDYIRECRKKAGMSQEELSEGICEPSNLSRIETGNQMPSRRTYEALMQKMGEDVSLFSSFSDRREMEFYRLENKISEKMANQKIEGLRELYVKMKALANGKDRLEQQYVMYTEALIRNLEGEGSVVVLPQLLEALHETRPNVHLENLQEDLQKIGLLTFQEINLLNNIAIAFWRGGKKESGMELMLYLKEYMEKHLVDEKEKGGHYPMVLFNLSKWFLQTEQPEKALEMALDGVKACNRYGKLFAFPKVLVAKADALSYLGKEKEAIDVYRQVFYLSQAMEEQERADRMKKIFLENYKVIVE